MQPINIAEFNYPLTEDQIAKFPIEVRSNSKLLVFDGQINDRKFNELPSFIPDDALVVFNNTKVVRARLVVFKPTGARIEIFCLDPLQPADYERAFAATGECSWHCIIGNAKKFNAPIPILFEGNNIIATRTDDTTVHFKWDSEHTFGQILEILGRIPIPPYLNRDSQEIDNSRYQTTYAHLEGSVAAPTAGLHFTEEVIGKLHATAFLTLHVGAGTFLPVKESDATRHNMHNEVFEIHVSELEKISPKQGKIIAIGTTSVRTLESLAALGYRVKTKGSPECHEPVGQWETYQNEPQGDELTLLLNYMKDNKIERLMGSTQIMITPSYKFRTIQGLVTNFHQPQSTLLLLISAVVGDKWRDIYKYAQENGYRFLSYGDSNLYFVQKPTK